MDPITYPSDIPSLLNPGFEEANFYGDYARFFAAFDNSYPWDEGWIQQRMSFAIYDDAKLRDSVNSLEWTTASGNSGESVNQRIQDHTSFVLENGIFFNFNRFTGELLE